MGAAPSGGFILNNIIRKEKIKAIRIYHRIELPSFFTFKTENFLGKWVSQIQIIINANLLLKRKLTQSNQSFMTQSNCIAAQSYPIKCIPLTAIKSNLLISLFTVTRMAARSTSSGTSDSHPRSKKKMKFMY